jgi:hypothetical protein
VFAPRNLLQPDLILRLSQKTTVEWSFWVGSSLTQEYKTSLEMIASNKYYILIVPMWWKKKFYDNHTRCQSFKLNLFVLLLMLWQNKLEGLFLLSFFRLVWYWQVRPKPTRVEIFTMIHTWAGSLPYLYITEKPDKLARGKHYCLFGLFVTDAVTYSAPSLWLGF